MKQSITPGANKSLSASLLKVLSGGIKCPTDGEVAISYPFSITFDYAPAGTPEALESIARVSMHFTNPNGSGEIIKGTAPRGKPKGGWVVIMELNIDTPIPAIQKNGEPSTLQYQFTVVERGSTPLSSLPPGKSPLHGGPWTAADTQTMDLAIINSKNILERIILFNSSNPNLISTGAAIGHSWDYPGAGGLFEVSGPNLYPFLQADFSSAGNYKVVFTLPEHDLFCYVSFFPMIGIPPNPANPQQSWFSYADGNGIMQAFGLGGIYDKALMPDGTKMGNMLITIIRQSLNALFTFEYVPPVGVRITNRSFYNGALHPTWLWEFGDGMTSTDFSPGIHSYALSGQYRVKLTMTDIVGETSTFDQLVDLTLRADFSYTVRRLGINGVITDFVTFTNASIGQLYTTQWNFGDGTTSGFGNPPEHRYSPGTYVVTLKVTDVYGHDASVSKTISLN